MKDRIARYFVGLSLIAISIFLNQHLTAETMTTPIGDVWVVQFD